jgi:hypothetical protein
VRADKVIVFLSLSFSLTQMNNEFLIWGFVNEHNWFRLLIFQEREADDGCDGTWVAHPGIAHWLIDWLIDSYSFILIHSFIHSYSFLLIHSFIHSFTLLFLFQGLVPLVTEIFATKLNGKSHQKHKLRSDVTITAQMLRDVFTLIISFIHWFNSYDAEMNAY